MATLPYVTSPGNIVKAFTGMRAAAVPERVSQDFVKTILKIPGGSGAQMTTYLKKLGFTNPDGSPNELYKRFRNPASSGGAVGNALKNAYGPLYVRNEFVHQLSDVDLLGLVVEETGEAHDSNPVKLIVSCIKNLKQFATFDSKSEQEITLPTPIKEIPPEPSTPPNERAWGVNLGYTINLNLPATSDPAVFDAIFKSLKEHLLRGQDG